MSLQVILELQFVDEVLHPFATLQSMYSWYYIFRLFLSYMNA